MINSYTIKHVYQTFIDKGYHLSLPKLATVLGELRNQGKISNTLQNRKYYYTDQDLVAIDYCLSEDNYHLDFDNMNENYFNLTEAASHLNNTPYTRAQLALMHLNHELESIMYKGQVRILKSQISQLKLDGDLSGYISATGFAKQLGVNSNYITQKIRKGHFKDVKHVLSRSYISIAESEGWKDEAQSPHSTYTNQDAIQFITTYFVEHSDRLPNISHDLFLAWITSKIADSHGRARSIKDIVSFGIHLYKLLLVHLSNNSVNELNDSIIESLLGNEFVNKRLKKELILFYNYSLSTKLQAPTKEFKIDRPSRKRKFQNDLKNDKKIYHPNVYQKYYAFVQDTSTHTKCSIKSRSYANMWLFVIMHLTNNWRANDIILQMPNITIENIGIDSFDWFVSNNLTTTQAQLIVNEVYLYFRDKVANKNLASLRFYLDPTLLISFATAMVLSELHSRNPLKTLKKHRSHLLGSFISGKNNEYIYTSGMEVHLKFFGNETDLKDFSSLVMNRSTMVYFFHHIVEGSESDSDLALDLTQTTRSHLKKDTTAIYVESSNQDGSINRVSINLFNRGHFGWLYNFMVNLVMDPNHRPHNLEDRTQQILELRTEINPLRIENWSEYFMTISKKRSSIVLQLTQFPEEVLLELLFKIFKGDMPGKQKEGQCLIHPKCEYPTRNNCFGCDYFIPKDMVLIEAVSDLKNRIAILRETNYEAIQIRENKFINGLLLLLSEAKKFLGKEKLNAFISTEELHRLIDEVSDKLRIEN